MNHLWVYIKPTQRCTKNDVFQRIWSHLLKKSLMENFIFRAVQILEVPLSFWRSHVESLLGNFWLFKSTHSEVAFKKVDLKNYVKLAKPLQWSSFSLSFR